MIKATLKFGNLTKERAVRAKDIARISVSTKLNVASQAATNAAAHASENRPLTVIVPTQRTSQLLRQKRPIFLAN